MGANYILAIDQGTTSSRAIVFDQQGHIISQAQKEFKQHYPKPGWVEHDPMDIWSSQSTVTAEAVSKANLRTDQIAAIGISNQRETVIVWDRQTGEPVYPAIVWQDRRTASYCKFLQDAGHGEEIRKRTGLLIDPYFCGTKVRWILEEVDGVRERAERGDLLFGTVDSWLVWKFTGGHVHVTDITNAARTMFFNIHTEEWDDELLALLDIPRSMLPEVKSSSEIYGRVDSQLYPAGVPMAGMAGDQHAALFGQACFTSGMAKNTYGTGCFLLMHTGEKAVPSANNLLTTIAWKIGGKTEYALEGSVFIAGAVIQWLRDEWHVVKSAKECDRLAATVDDAGGLFLVPAFTGLGAPHWDPTARGAMFGITRGTHRAHLCRAALESIALQSYDLVRAMERDSGLQLKEFRVDGGAARSEPLMQFQSDILQSDVVRPNCIETTALGAAYLAGLAVGYWPDRDAIARNWEEDTRYTPARSSGQVERIITDWQEAVQRSCHWASDA